MRCNEDIHNTKCYKKKIRKDLIKFCNCQYFTHSLTLNFNSDITLATAESKVRKFHQRVNRSIMGKGYEKYPDDQFQSFGVFEHIHHNLHMHLCSKMALQYWYENYEYRRLKNAIEIHWSTLAPAGDVKLKCLYDPTGAFVYSTKEYWKDDFSDQYYLFGRK